MLTVATLLPVQTLAQTIDLDPAEAVETDIDRPEVDGSGAEALIEEAESGAENAAGATAKPPPKRVVRPQPFLVRQVLFTSSGYLELDELAALAARFVGTRILPSEARKIADAATALYQDKDIALAEGIVAGVEPGAGVVRIELFEARLGEIAFEAENMSDAYLRFRLGFAPGDLADNRKIDKALRRLASTDGVRADANFSAGGSRGLTDLSVRFEEPARISGTAGFDVYGNPATGDERVTLNWRNASLTGWNDPLSLSVIAAAGLINLSGAYERVVLADGTALSMSGAYEYSDSVDGPEVLANTAFAELGVRSPLVATDRHRFDVSFAGRYFFDTSELVGVRTVDQHGFLGVLGAAGVRRGENWELAIALQARAGHYDDAIASHDDRFFAAFDGQATYVAALPSDHIVTASGAFRFAAHDLPKHLQFTVTSPFAVRGYPVGLSSGGTGYWARLQIEKASALPILPPEFTARPFAFADIGEAFEVTSSGQEGQGVAVSVGGGLLFSIHEHAAAEFYLAKPLTDLLGMTAAGTWTVRGGVTTSF